MEDEKIEVTEVTEVTERVNEKGYVVRRELTPTGLREVEYRVMPNGGMLRVGNPGYGGGLPLTPQQLRQRARQILDQRIEVTDDIISGNIKEEASSKCPKCGTVVYFTVSAQVRDRVSALALLAKIGIPTQQSINMVSDEVRDRIKAMVTLIQSKPSWVSTELLGELEPIWAE